jgi:hypothetical protein
VHHSIELFHLPNLRHNSLFNNNMYSYTTILDVFRALTCPSSGGPIVFSQHLVMSLSGNDCTVHRLRAELVNEIILHYFCCTLMFFLLPSFGCTMALGLTQPQTETNTRNILIIKPTRCTNFSNLFWNRTLHVLDRFSVHHQESTTVYTAISLCLTGYAGWLLADRQHNL